MPIPPMPTKWMRLLVSNNTCPSFPFKVAGARFKKVALCTSHFAPCIVTDMSPPLRSAAETVYTPGIRGRSPWLRPVVLKPQPLAPSLPAVLGRSSSVRFLGSGARESTQHQAPGEQPLPGPIPQHSPVDDHPPHRGTESRLPVSPGR